MFKKRFINVKRNPDRIWFSERSKFAGIIAYIDTLDSQSSCVVLVAHFPSTFRNLETLLQSEARTYETYPTPLEARRLAETSEYEAESRILLVLASTLPIPSTEWPPQTHPSNLEIVFIVAEHHPLPGEDDRVQHFAQRLPFISSLVFNESLDGAFFRHYHGDQVRQLMINLNVPENLPLSNTMVDKTIRNAQEKLAKRVKQNLSADTAEQWFQQNV